MMLASLGLAACASTPPGSDEPLTRAELLAAEETTVYAALRELRPHWLRRTVDDPVGVAVRAGGPPPPLSARMCTALAFIADERAGAEDLRRTTLARVLEIRLIPPGAVRPDGQRCTHNRPSIHVVLLDG